MIEAVKAGADVYVQKPTGVDVIESEAMLAAARKYGRVVQVGLQRRSTPHLIEAVNDIIKAGRLGKVSHVEIFCYYKMRAKGNPPVIAPPPTLDFEMWTGPAPLIPFTEMIHPRKWRAFMEYGNGIVGDSVGPRRSQAMEGSSSIKRVGPTSVTPRPLPLVTRI
jgi:hypothetical protein